MALKGRLEYLVLDEADRLLDDMGLGDQVRQIVQRLRANQTGAGRYQNGVTWRSVLVSATVTPAVEALANSALQAITDIIADWSHVAERRPFSAKCCVLCVEAP